MQAGRREMTAFVVICLFALLAVACPVAVSTGEWGVLAAWALTFLPGVFIVLQAYRCRDPRQSMPMTFFSMMFRVAAVLEGAA